MLILLKIKNVALIDRLEVEFRPGLDLLTGETGSGKSIIVDSLGALTGDRVSSDLLKEGEDLAHIEGVFAVGPASDLRGILDESGIETGDGSEIIIRREISRSGKNRIFVNDQAVTQGLLKRIGALMVDIHGQGEQATLYDASSHIRVLDEFAAAETQRTAVASAYREWSSAAAELASLESDEAQKLQLVDLLRFQAAEIMRAAPEPEEDTRLEDEKRRLNNIEKLSTLSDEAYLLLYDSDTSTAATLEKAARRIAELAEYDHAFLEFDEGLKAAQAVINEAGTAARDFRGRLEFSPERLNEIEDRLAELSRLKRKYGDSIDAVLAHLADAQRRLETIETAEFRGAELKKRLVQLRAAYISAAGKLHEKRVSAARSFEKAVEANLRDVALERARFEVRIDGAADDPDAHFTANGYDRVEFYFSANPGESTRPLARVASGGEASRLMLVLKTTARSGGGEKAAVFDEIDIGIGGRVAEAVGRKLKQLAATQQVLCVTHQPQIAALADHHYLVEKAVRSGRTTITMRELDPQERIEEIARMLAGEQITDAARENAQAMLAAS